ncbi:outer membrane protein transport protein [Enterobacter ludwigii]|uniref:OmpP1/FadL family transporter n=1 Tax=Enterobacter ludwigii TaxID=299767 RepID=UPI00159C6131|nr:outer membrane protein transport protein [Enterobacter ludwigii]QLA06290.1 outer membrane protein transport protein [Enterobacter ludwigii]
MKKLSLTVLSLLFTHVTHASGLYFYEFATEDTALAGAGQAGRAQDASTIVTNPAGMTRLPDHLFTSGFQLMGGDISYNLDNDSRRKSPGNIVPLYPNASAFYTQKIGDDLYAGLGLYGNYGLGMDYGNWAGERLIKETTMVALTMSPSLAWRLSDRISLGGSVNVNYGFLSLTRNVDSADKTEKDHDWAPSYRLGLLMELTDLTRAGITWTSKTDYDFKIDGKARFPNLSNVEYVLPVSAQVRAPQQIMMSLVHDFNKQWSVMGDLGWQDWSQFGAPEVTIAGVQTNKNNRLKDSWHTALGVQYRPVDLWRLNVGVAYDSTIYRSQSDVALTLPTGDEWRFASGAQYQVTPQSNIGFAISYLHMQSSRVRSPAFYQGRYNDPYLWFASMNYSCQF